MNEHRIVCTHCGTVGNTKDGYCKNCWKTFEGVATREDAVIDGINKSDWEAFIGKKADRYLKVFAKNNGKKWFISFNWAAALLSFSWMFYRRMYKFAIMGYAALLLLSTLFSLLLMLPHREEVKELQSTIAAYESYIDHGGETVLTDANGERYSPQIVKDGAAAEKALIEIDSSIARKMLILQILAMLAMGLFGDAIYKQYVRQHISDPKKGGASIGAWWIGRILCDIVQILLLDPMVMLATFIVMFV